MTTPKPRQSVDISGMETVLQAIADKEDRSMSNLLRVMVTEALSLRQDPRSLKLQEILKGLVLLDRRETVQVIESAVEHLLEIDGDEETRAKDSFIRKLISGEATDLDASELSEVMELEDKEARALIQVVRRLKNGGKQTNGV